jgi:hypothetical protein
MRRADFSRGQGAARVGEAYAPSSAFAQPNAHNPPDNGVAWSRHAQAKATGIVHFVCARVAYTPGSVQTLPRHAPRHNRPGDISGRYIRSSILPARTSQRLTGRSSACFTNESER